MIAQVCLNPRKRIHGGRDASSGSRAAAAAAGGLRYSASQRASHRKPSEPVTTNAQRHPQVRAIHGTMIGVTIAPVFVPALKSPVASARSSFGNHSATVLIAPGKFADSPRPSSARAAENAAVERAKAWPIAARLHTT